MIRRVSAGAMMIAATALVAGQAGPPGAAAISAGLLSAAPATTWQTNGPVDALAYAGGVLYVGGEFTAVRPRGAAKGTHEVARTGLAAFNASTGALITQFAPRLVGPSGAAANVYALTRSRDGSRLYVGGRFVSVNGTARRSLAAFSTSTRALLGWNPRLGGGNVRGIATASDGTVYFGGSFATVSGRGRHNAAAVDKAGAVLPWRPSTDGAVRALRVSPDGSEVVIGGSFAHVDGAVHQGLMAVDRGAGSLVAAWGAGPRLSRNFEIYHMAGDAQHVYVASVDVGQRYGDPEFDGTASLAWGNGSVVWADYCRGDSQAVAIVGDVLFVGSHSHDCHTVPGGFPAGTVRHHLMAERLTDGRIRAWDPNTNRGPDSTDQGPRVMATDGSQLFVGGDFTAVNGVPQQGLTRFTAGPDRTTPTVPGTPAASVTSPGRVTVTFRSGWDRDDGFVKYLVYRDGASSPVATARVSSRFWRRPTVQVVDSPPPGTHTYTVVSTDGTNRSAPTAPSNRVTTP